MLKGKGFVKTKKDKNDVNEGDQVLIIDSEPFYVSAKDGREEMIVQFCWLPGFYKCEECEKN